MEKTHFIMRPHTRHPDPAGLLPAQAVVVQKGAYFVWSQGKVEEFGEEH